MSSQLLSPPSSPFQNHINPLVVSKEEEKIQNNNTSPMSPPKECFIEISNEENLRNKYNDMIKNGIEMNNEIIPYPYYIEKLHRIGRSIFNKNIKDSLLLRVYEFDKDLYEDFWVHPMILSLQSFLFFKIFQEVESYSEDDIIEIEVPSLDAFHRILYLLYTGDIDKTLENVEFDDNIFKGIFENINYLEINSHSF